MRWLTSQQEQLHFYLDFAYSRYGVASTGSPACTTHSLAQSLTYVQSQAQKNEYHDQRMQHIPIRQTPTISKSLARAEYRSLGTNFSPSVVARVAGCLGETINTVP